MLLAAILVILLIMTMIMAAVPAVAQNYNSINMESSSSYLRVGMNDTVTLTVQMYNDNSPAPVEGVPIVLNFLSAKDYMVFDDQTIVTDKNGSGSTTIHINPDNTPERYKMPMVVQIEAATQDGYHRCSINVYITGTGSISGYVIDGDMSTITDANITVKGPDGKPAKYTTTPITSGNGSENGMGAYRIDGLPLNVGKYEITASKKGYNGTIRVEPSTDGGRYDITINGYQDNVDSPKVTPGSQGYLTTSPTLSPTLVTSNSDTEPARPTSMTTTIIVAIALIALVYLGLKAYRRMF